MNLRASIVLFYFCCCIQASYAFKMISFNGKVARWHSSVVDYVVDSRGSDDFTNGCDLDGPCESERSAIAKAFAAWENIPNINLSFNEQTPKTIGNTGYNNENSIKWIESGWTSQSFAPAASAIAVTVQTFKTSNNQILDMDIYANGQFHWGAINSSKERNASQVMDIQNIFTHEVGHGIGIDHSSENISEPSREHYLATMFFASGPGETFRRDLKDIDVAAAQHAYTSVNFPKPEIDSISQNSFDLTNQYAHQITIEGSNFRSTTLVSLKVGSYNDDVQAKIISQSSNSMLVEFDFSGMPSGEFNLIVANSYNESDIDVLENAIQIESPYAVASEYSNTSQPSAAKACRSGQPSFILLILIALLSSLYEKKRTLIFQKRTPKIKK